MTDFDTTNESTPTAPLPVAGDATPTAPLPPLEPGAAATAPAADRAWRPSTGAVVAIVLAGALAISAVSFGAGWGAHGLASRFSERHAFMMSARGGAQSFGYGRGYGNGQDSNGYGERGWSDSAPGSGYGGRGMGQGGGWGGQSAPDGVPGQGQQQGFQQDGYQGGVCPGQTW